MSNLVIRADASPRIGTGHVMRCLALAQDWLADGGRVLCVCASLPEALERLLRIEGCDVTRIECEPGSADDATETLVALHRWIADSNGTSNLRRPTPELGGPTAGFWLVADGYHFGSDYQRETKEKGWRLLIMDDYGHASHYHADFVLNQNLHARAGLYARREPGTQLLLGPKFALLRRQFKPWRDWRREVPTVARKVLVTLGGADPDSVTGDVADAL